MSARPGLRVPPVNTVGAVINRPGIWAAGRRPRGTGSRQGAVSTGDAPPILFLFLTKRECAAPGGREKGARRAPVQWPSARDGGRRIGASADFARPSGTLGSSTNLQLPSRGGWCVLGRGARTHLTSFSFRAFRFATRYPGGRGSLYHTRPKAFRVPVGADALIGPLHQLPRGMASGSEKRSCSMRRPPR